MTSTIQQFDYMDAARETWHVAGIRIDELPDGTHGIAMDQSDIVLRAIANRICGSSSGLTGADLEFLYYVLDAPLGLVAEGLRTSERALRRQMDSKVPLRHPWDLTAKLWFWSQIFGKKPYSLTFTEPAPTPYPGFMVLVANAFARSGGCAWAWRDGEPSSP